MTRVFKRSASALLDLVFLILLLGVVLSMALSDTSYGERREIDEAAVG
jgi:hypothetical protein